MFAFLAIEKNSGLLGRGYPALLNSFFFFCAEEWVEVKYTERGSSILGVRLHCIKPSRQNPRDLWAKKLSEALKKVVVLCYQVGRVI